MKWIDVDERLPWEEEGVIMTYNNLVFSGWFSEGEFFYYSGCGSAECQEGITHWMPLPLPPNKS